MIEVYILLCADNTYYTGITQDFSVRFLQHNSKKVSYTRNRLPLKKVYSTMLQDRKSAAKLEREIKNIGAQKWMKRHAKIHEFKKSGLISFISSAS